MDTIVQKATGEREKFDPSKLCASLLDAGAPKDLAQNVCLAIEKKITPEVTTSQIFRDAVSYLIHEDIRTTARYSLRRGLAMLGPAGFLFEQYVEALMQAEGYATERDLMIDGQCVDHEIDVLAKKGDEVILIEAKYRNQHEIKTHLDVVMYADARKEDINQRVTKEKGVKPYDMWVVTNTRFTEKAIRYAQCRNMKLIGWKYPTHGHLQDLITKHKLYPVTVLPSVSTFELEKFAEKGMILAQDLLPYQQQDLTREFGIPPEIARVILDEVFEIVKV